MSGSTSLIVKKNLSQFQYSSMLVSALFTSEEFSSSTRVFPSNSIVSNLAEDEIVGHPIKLLEKRFSF